MWCADGAVQREHRISSRRILTYAISVFVFFHLMVILYEEQALKRKFGASYEEYLKTVPRW